MIEGHGDDIHRYEGKILHNFSSNVYYKGCPPELLTELAKKTQMIQSYPSPGAQELSIAASQRFDLPVDHFLFTNGATEAFYLIAHIFSGRKAAIVAPTFSEYEDACSIHELDYSLVSKDNLITSNFDPIFICNPNNPDGSIISSEELKEMIESAPSTTFVIDEAYIEFTDQLQSVAQYVKEVDNLIVVKSLTKTFTIPGLRLGYVIAPARIINKLLSKKMPWSVNALAVHAGLQLFKYYDRWLFNVRELLAETSTFRQHLSAISWLTVKPSSTSYFLVELKKGSAAELKEYLALEHGVLIRDATNFKGLHGQYIRLATQSTEANQVLIKALKIWN